MERWGAVHHTVPYHTKAKALIVISPPQPLAGCDGARRSPATAARAAANATASHLERRRPGYSPSKPRCAASWPSSSSRPPMPSSSGGAASWRLAAPSAGRQARRRATALPGQLTGPHHLGALPPFFQGGRRLFRRRRHDSTGGRGGGE